MGYGGSTGGGGLPGCGPAALESAEGDLLGETSTVTRGDCRHEVRDSEAISVAAGDGTLAGAMMRRVDGRAQLTAEGRVSSGPAI